MNERVHWCHQRHINGMLPKVTKRWQHGGKYKHVIHGQKLFDNHQSRRCDLKTVRHCHLRFMCFTFQISQQVCDTIFKKKIYLNIKHSPLWSSSLRDTSIWHTWSKRREAQSRPTRWEKRRNSFSKISTRSWRREIHPSRESQTWASNKVLQRYSSFYPILSERAAFNAF